MTPSSRMDVSAVPHSEGSVPLLQQRGRTGHRGGVEGRDCVCQKAGKEHTVVFKGTRGRAGRKAPTLHPPQPHNPRKSSQPVAVHSELQQGGHGSLPAPVLQCGEARKGA